MSREQEVKTHQPRRRGPMGHGMQPGEKPKDFKKSIKKLMSYIGKMGYVSEVRRAIIVGF